jgi:preprotein translocase subunit SecG
MLYGIILTLIVIICALLILVVMLQPGQREGLSGGLAAGMAGSGGLGARRTADILSKSTTYLAAAFLTLSVLANFAIDKTQPTRSAVQQTALPEAVAPMPAPAQLPVQVPAQAETPAAADASEGDSTP